MRGVCRKAANKSSKQKQKILGHHRKMNINGEKQKRDVCVWGGIDIKELIKYKARISRKKIRHPAKYKSSMLLYS